MNIRRANENDFKQIAKVHVDTWRTAYNGLIDDDYLKNLSYSKKENMWAQILKENNEYIYVAEANGHVVGFATCGKERGNSNIIMGEIYAIYILKEFERKGYGKRLVSACAEKLSSMEAESLIIWMLDGNTAGRFYEALGGKRTREAHINIGGANRKIVAYMWNDIKKLI